MIKITLTGVKEVQRELRRLGKEVEHSISAIEKAHDRQRRIADILGTKKDDLSTKE